MYTLYGYPKTRSVRVAWALEELGLPYDYQLIDLRQGQHLTDAFRALSPAAKIPILITPEGTLSESAAIVTYLAERHGMHEFIPESGSFARAKYEEVLVFLVAELEQPLWNIAKHTFALPEDKRIAQMRDVAAWEFERAMKTFSILLGDKPYVCGDMFTMADVVAGHILAWAKGSKLSHSYDNVHTYTEKVLARPAYTKAWQGEADKLPK